MEWKDIKTDPPKFGETIIIQFEDGGYGIGYVEYEGVNNQRLRLYPCGVESTYDGCGQCVFYDVAKLWKPISCIE